MLMQKLKSCPLCGCKEDAGHARCFHCVQCEYLQCCDYDGFYTTRLPGAPQEASDDDEVAGTYMVSVAASSGETITFVFPTETTT